MGRARRIRASVLAGMAALLGLACAAPIAGAAFHLMKVREVHEGGTTAADYVELQMYAQGQRFVSGHVLETYDGGGNPFQTYVIPGSVANGDNQRTVLIASTGALGVAPDFVVPTANLLVGTGGSACFIDTLPSNGIDCVSWGAAAPPTANPSPVGSPVLLTTGIAAGQSIHRSIARNCPTLLEAADDTNDSAADFALGTPSPRPNSVAPTEKACGSGGGSGPGPDLELSGSKKQKAGGKVVVKAQCTDQDCSLEATGKSKLKKARAKSSATAAGRSR